LVKRKENKKKEAAATRCGFCITFYITDREEKGKKRKEKEM